MKDAFRVWDGKTMWYPYGGEHVEGLQYDDIYGMSNEGNVFRTEYDSCGNPQKHVYDENLIGMFDTGSVDKNDVPIYDADIVNWNATGLNQILWRVAWNNVSSRHVPHGWMLYHRACEGKEHSFIHLSVACAGWLYLGHDGMPLVVGNTYENSELMT